MQQDNTWTNDDPDLGRYMATIGHNMFESVDNK